MGRKAAAHQIISGMVFTGHCFVSKTAFIEDDEKRAAVNKKLARLRNPHLDTMEAMQAQIDELKTIISQLTNQQ